MSLCCHKTVHNVEEADVLTTANSVYKNNIIFVFTNEFYL